MKPGTWKARQGTFWLLLGLIGSTLLLHGLVQAYLAEPAARALFWLRLRYLSIPQNVLWMVFLLLAGVLFSASLLRPVNMQPWQWEEQDLSTDRPLKRLARRIERTDSAYARQRVCQVVSELAVRILAARLDLSPHQIKTEILQGRLSLPEDVASYLREGLKLNRRVIEDGWVRLRAVASQPAEPGVDPRLIATLEFLENQATL